MLVKILLNRNNRFNKYFQLKALMFNFEIIEY